MRGAARSGVVSAARSGIVWAARSGVVWVARSGVVRAARAAAVLLAVLAADAAIARAQTASLRIQGTFTMTGTLTAAVDVFGERPGERVDRRWSFFPQCARGTCRRVQLKRRRSGRHILDVVMLARQPSGLYLGQSTFWIPLQCAGQVESHGGLAAETIAVRVTRTQLIGTTRFATAISASYTNPSRTNLTHCPGGIGHDAASYTGRLRSPLPGPPTARFTAIPDLATTTASFTDESMPGRGAARIVAWSWNFGDPGSLTDTSTRPGPMHQFSAPGTYTVTLTVRDGYGQTSTTTAQVTV
jgi:PKD domain